MNAAADRAVVLLIEDHTDTREMYALMLGAAGFDVLVGSLAAVGRSTIAV